MAPIAVEEGSSESENWHYLSMEYVDGLDLAELKLAEDAGLTTWDAPGYIVLHVTASPSTTARTREVREKSESVTRAVGAW